MARPVERPSAPPPHLIRDSAGAGLGQPLPRRPAPNRQKRENSEQDQYLEPTVSPATLLETSLIASTLANAESDGNAPALSRPAPWQPPQSSLTLRDRTV
ncbi:hypothetical protein [Pelagibacterium halotolerans]|uniref:Uncharacterized protein n=1 Tax=Pelagibacterium halotolerans (strain DSM 22347 / JCM 15775 / CGMCC 1.7692 / B2) TaxID=1082931 RepID=G4RER4_PELHB|nr:hypothetical protein [Pelagibacterium halotolerans]AEQ51885.1 hypothetical protein KKY_1874 [Pelagibacterium halotolerans B2]QJR18311.1 hypothetical protein HKM20_07630 [Pelagibacterium halotolerans]SEA26057.1 hypothetical protein SAMN05428936_102509 [Pelagibacterium halotolerans]